MNCITTFLCAIIITITTFFYLPNKASAQLAITDIGISPLTNERFQCVRFTEVSQNKIMIEKLASGKIKEVSQKAAKRRLKKQDKKVSRQLKNSRQSLVDARRTLRNFLKKPPSKQNAEKLLKLNKRIEKLELRVSTLTGQKGIIKELRNSVIACGKKEVGIGASLRIASGTYILPVVNRLHFWAAIQLVIDPLKAASLGLVDGSRICLAVTGNNAPIPGIGGAYSADGVPSIRFVLQDPCAVRGKAVGNIPGECYGSAAGLGMLLASHGGRQEPGTCTFDTFTFNCSLEETLAELNKRLAQMSVVSIKKANGNSCK